MVEWSKPARAPDSDFRDGWQVLYGRGRCDKQVRVEGLRRGGTCDDPREPDSARRASRSGTRRRNIRIGATKGGKQHKGAGLGECEVSNYASDCELGGCGERGTADGERIAINVPRSSTAGGARYGKRSPVSPSAARTSNRSLELVRGDNGGGCTGRHGRCPWLLAPFRWNLKRTRGWNAGLTAKT